MSSAATNPTLAGRHALVTGGGSGIGAAIATALARAGASVTTGQRRSPPLAEGPATLPEGGIEAVELDVTWPEPRLADLVARIEAQRGPIAILVNAAGAAPSAPLARTDPGLWAAALAVNLTGTYAMMRCVLPGMQARGSGRIVNIASTAGLVGYPYVAAYCAAKHGVIGLTRALALEVARTGVTINAVCPGFTETPLIDRALATITAKTGRSEEEARASLVARNPQGRLVRPEEVADSVLYLVGDGAASVTGQAIVVAGGEVQAG